MTRRPRRASYRGTGRPTPKKTRSPRTFHGTAMRMRKQPRTKRMMRRPEKRGALQCASGGLLVAELLAISTCVQIAPAQYMPTPNLSDVVR